MLKLGLIPALGLLVVGTALVVVGVAMVYPPAAFVLGGLGLTAFVLWGVEV